MTKAVGFIGVGTIATAMVLGLRSAWPALRMHLSPRSKLVSRMLAEHNSGVFREVSNAAVIAASDVVVLSVLPTQVDDVIRELRFSADQIVVSCIAGTPLSDLTSLVAPARVCRLVPLPMIARREGPIVVYPALPEITSLFEGLGDIVIPEDERDFAFYVGGSATMSSFFALQGAITGWMTANGTAAVSASTYVSSLFRALAETAHLTEAVDRPGLVAGHETPGGLNARVRRTLEDRGWFDAPGDALEGLARLRRTDLITDKGA